MARPIGGGGRVAAISLMVLTLLAMALPESVVAQDLAGDRAALVALSGALDRGRLLPWDTTAATPCEWRGVKCGQSNAGDQRVVELRLPGKQLSGTIPAGTVGSLTALTRLSLRHNAITGEIPADVGNLGELRVLSLRNNRLTGGVPDGVYSLGVLKHLDLALNGLTGGVSQELNRLKQLDTLFLERNFFSGEIPAGLYLPSLSRLNVSFNSQLNGPLPASFARLPSSSFLGTELCDGPLAACSPATPPPAGKKKLSRWAVVGIVVAAAVILLLIIGLVAFLRRRRQAAAAAPAAGRSAAAANVHGGTVPITVTVARTDRDAAVTKQSHTPPLAPAMVSDGKKLVFLGSAPERPYDLETLLRASAEVLGKGTHGTTYRATLDGGEPVLAIKRLREVRLSEREFQDKAAALGALHHDNLPRLRAYFYSKEEKLLVYDFVSGAGSLSAVLHGSSSSSTSPPPLDFTARARIALAAARGVAFIHRGSSTTHGSIKSSNIVVTAARDGAFVSDYGVAGLAGGAEAEVTRKDAGYHAPEVTDARAVTRSADVYSFGVVVLELLSGRAPGLAGEGGVDLPRWVRSVVQEEWTSEVFDATIANEEGVEEEMLRLLQLGMDCTEKHPDRRPSMDEVEARIERIVEDACRKADFSSTDGSRSVSA